MNETSGSLSSELTDATRAGERIEVLDILRGVALFGVVVVNMSVDTYWSNWLVSQSPGKLDNVSASLLTLFGAGKFLTIFSFMFGLGVFMQVQRCKDRGAPFGLLMLRRLSILLLIGLMHYLLVGWTDILHVYALLGMLLLLFHRSSAKTLLTTAVLLFLLNIGDPKPIAIMAIESVVLAPQGELVAGNDMPDSGPLQLSELTTIYSSGSYREILRANFIDFEEYLGTYAARWWIGSLFPVILIGAYVARRRIVENIGEHTPVIRRVFWWCLAIGLAGSGWTLAAELLWKDEALSFHARQIKNAFDIVGIRALGFAYASGLLLLLQNYSWRKRMAPFGAVGRTALTNYLLQTAVAVIVFYGIGFGLYGKVNPVHGALLAVGTFMIQVRASQLWLDKFHYGPVEWLWRSMTYGRPQRMRRQPAC